MSSYEKIIALVSLIPSSYNAIYDKFHNHHRQKQQIENQDWQPDGEFVMSVMSSTIFKSSTIIIQGIKENFVKLQK